MTDLYALEKFGFSPWALWRIARGNFGDLCDRCGGRGFTVTSPCENREPGRLEACSLASGCSRCRVRCRCEQPALHAEDFGDEDSRELAGRLGVVKVDPDPRVDREPRAL